MTYIMVFIVPIVACCVGSSDPCIGVTFMLKNWKMSDNTGIIIAAVNAKCGTAVRSKPKKL